ncbi:MAG: hypothetical protein CME68_05090 [Halobacteriovoraceae bacterium]|nr:hypothetical protein [Halobacteriovoraceae bacterium]
MKGIVLYGSQSDRVFFEDCLEKLRPHSEFIFEVLSAHRDGEKLRLLCQSLDANYVIAGAGLSAALPGCVSSQTKVPVFGVPLPSCFGGLDAFLASLQMPKGTPVATCAPYNESSIISFIEKIQDEKWAKEKRVNVYVDSLVQPYEYVDKALRDLLKISKEENIDLEISNQFNPNTWNILLVHQEKEIVLKSNCLHVPMMNKQTMDNPSRALNLFSLAEKGGLWFGVNNCINALRWLKRGFDSF